VADDAQRSVVIVALACEIRREILIWIAVYDLDAANFFFSGRDLRRRRHLGREQLDPAGSF